MRWRTSISSQPTRGEHLEGPDEERQPFLQGHDQPALQLLQWTRWRKDMGRRRPLLLARLEAEAEIDVKLLLQRQAQHRVAGSLLDGAECGLQAAFGPGCNHEPQVIAMLALVVVIDLGKTVHCLRDDFQLFRRHGHRRQCRGADALGCKDRPDARDLAFAAKIFQPADDHSFGHAKARRQLGKRRRAEREIALEIVEQPELQRGIEGLFHVVFQKPMRAARLVKKMPDGACAANSPTLAKLAVS